MNKSSLNFDELIARKKSLFNPLSAERINIDTPKNFLKTSQLQEMRPQIVSKIFLLPLFIFFSGMEKSGKKCLFSGPPS